MAGDFVYTKRDLARIGFSCIQFNLKKTTRKISAYYDEILKPSGLKATQFSVLIVVAMGEASSITGLSKLVDVDRTTLQRSIDILERDGILNVQSGSKGNVRNISITPSGKKKLELAIGLWKTVQERFIKELGSEKVKALLKVLGETRRVKL